MAIYLGIDGGGSKTACVIGDETRVLGRGAAGASNVVRVGEAAARREMHAAILQACLEAGVEPLQVSRAVIGLAGAAQPEVRKAVQRIVGEILSAVIEVVGDMDIALHAAFGVNPGVIVIAGTGSIAFGRNRAGESARAGGWGFAVSDEGSGDWIGRKALAAALRIRDEGGSTPLLAGVQKYWKVESFDQLIISANAAPRADFAGLFSTVVSVADSGDEIAQTVLTQAGDELARLAAIVIGRLSPEGNVQVAMAGGVFRHSPLVKDAFRDRLVALHADAVIVPAMADPVDGALAMARIIHES